MESCTKQKPPPVVSLNLNSEVVLACWSLRSLYRLNFQNVLLLFQLPEIQIKNITHSLPVDKKINKKQDLNFL